MDDTGELMGVHASPKRLPRRRKQILTFAVLLAVLISTATVISVAHFTRPYTPCGGFPMAESIPHDLSPVERTAHDRQLEIIMGMFPTPERFETFLQSSLFNSHGVSNQIYIRVALYNMETGASLSHDRVLEFRSSLREPDGCPRLYNSGLHSDIEKYVNWGWEPSLRRAAEREAAFHRALLEIARDYRERNPQREGELPLGHEFPQISLHHLSPQAIDALARAYADPNYELDLTELLYPGTGWAHIERLYAELLEIHGLDPDTLPEGQPPGDGLAFTRTIFGLGNLHPLVFMSGLFEAYAEDGGVAFLAAERERVASQGGGG